MSANTRDPYEPRVDNQTAGRLATFILLLVALGGGAFIFWRTRTSVEPTRILVAIDIDGQWWQGSKPAAKAADEMAGWLRDLGFDPVRAGDPAVTEALERAADPVEAARALDAGFVIAAKFEPTLTQHPIGDGYFEARAQGKVQVIYVGDRQAPAEATVEGWSGARDQARALEALGSSVALRTFDAALAALVDHPKLATFFEDNPRKVPAERLQQLKQARAFVSSRARKLQTAQVAYKNLGESRIDKEKGAVQVTYHGTLADDDALCGTGPGGYLVRSAPVTPFVSPDSGELGWIEGLEALEWRTADGERKPLWRGYNVFGYPAAAPEGAPVVLVEDLFGWAKTVTVIGADGQVNRLKIDPEHRFSAPVVAPGGGAVALLDRACRDECPSDLVVLSLADGQELYRAGPEGGSFDGHAWLDAKRLVFLHDPAPAAGAAADGNGAEPAGAPGARRFEAPRQTLWLVDLSAPGATPHALMTVGEGETLSWLRAAAGGRRLAAAYRGPRFRGLATIAVGGATATLTPHDVGGEATAPVFSPDGARIAFNLVPVGDGTDEEVAVMPAAGGEVKRLTDNPFRDRYPQWSADGSRLYFESLDHDPNFPRARNVSVVASVPVPP